MASGVRSSWEALATKRRWPSNAASSRAEHVVERVGQLTELVPRAGQADPLVQVAVGDPAGGRGDLLERPQRPAGDQPAGADTGDREAAEREPAPGEQRVERLLLSLLLDVLGELHLLLDHLTLRGGQVSSRATMPGPAPTPTNVFVAPSGGSTPSLTDDDMITSPFSRLPVERGVHQQVGDGEQADPGEQEQAAVDRGQAGADASAGSSDPVPHSRHGLDHLRVAELAAQLHHGHPHHVGERVGVLVPRPSPAAARR